MQRRKQCGNKRGRNGKKAARERIKVSKKERKGERNRKTKRRKMK